MSTQAVFFLAYSAVMLPVPVALLAGWTPPRWRDRPAARRPLAAGLLLIWACGAVNACARLLGASPAALLVVTAAGLLLTAAGFAVLLRAARRR
ncbi:hypothetical protein KNE206_18120 [Kitasatospora sp. NE20-6]|uniref:hypothetical protein n=1 Tax=Kitasatospora sp. NE20-6 TaxID=2859066 RepID=UPI0034DC422B